MNAVLVRIVALVAIFGSIFLLSHFFMRAVVTRRAERSAVNRRLQLLKSGLSSETVVTLMRKGLNQRPGENASMFERMRFTFGRMVFVSNIGMSPAALLTGCALGFAAILAALLLFTWTARIPMNIGIIELGVGLAAAVAFGLPYFLVSRRAEQRRKRMEEQFPVALDVFVRALRAGHPVASAIDLLTNEMEDPIGSEFGLVSDEVSYGANLTDALLGMAERWDLEDIRMFVVSLSLQSETGGNLAEILGNLSTVIRDRASMFLKVRALSSEGRMSGLMLTVLPVVTFISMFMANPGFYLDVAATPMFIYGFSGLIVLYFIGVIAIRKMVDLKV